AVPRDHAAVAQAVPDSGDHHLGRLDLQHVQHHLPGHAGRARRRHRDPDHPGVQVRVRAIPLRLRRGLLRDHLPHPAGLRDRPEPRHPRDGGLMGRRSREELPHPPLHAILLAATLFTIYPILWVLTIALSGKQSLAIADLPAEPGIWDRLRAIIPWPETISLANFRSLFADQPFTRWLVNSAIVAAATTILGIVLAATAGYAFSRFRFPGRRVGLMSFLVSQMFPGVLTLIPLYIIVVKWLGLGS